MGGTPGPSVHEVSGFGLWITSSSKYPCWGSSTWSFNRWNVAGLQTGQSHHAVLPKASWGAEGRLLLGSCRQRKLPSILVFRTLFQSPEEEKRNIHLIDCFTTLTADKWKKAADTSFINQSIKYFYSNLFMSSYFTSSKRTSMLTWRWQRTLFNLLLFGTGLSFGTRLLCFSYKGVGGGWRLCVTGLLKAFSVGMDVLLQVQTRQGAAGRILYKRNPVWSALVWVHLHSSRFWKK